MIYLPISITAKAERLAVSDPHGLTVTLVAVGVVFTSLIILCFIYNLSGNIFSGKYSEAGKKRRSRKEASSRKQEAKGNGSEIAAAISLALSASLGEETQAAISTALHLYLSGNAHDNEPLVITIKRQDSPWGNKNMNFRKYR